MVLKDELIRSLALHALLAGGQQGRTSSLHEAQMRRVGSQDQNGGACLRPSIQRALGSWGLGPREASTSGVRAPRLGTVTAGGTLGGTEAPRLAKAQWSVPAWLDWGGSGCSPSTPTGAIFTVP